MCKGLSGTYQLISWRVKTSIKHLVRELRYLYTTSSASTKSHSVSMDLVTLPQFSSYTATRNHVCRCRSLAETFQVPTSEIKHNWNQSWALFFCSAHMLLRSTHQDPQAAIPAEWISAPSVTHFLSPLSFSHSCFCPLVPTPSAHVRVLPELIHVANPVENCFLFSFWGRWGMTKLMFCRMSELNQLTGNMRDKNEVRTEST